jgi:PPM family protein phosphatase
MNFSIHQASHIGNRKYNQDRVAYAYSNDALLLVLADGMGGHLNGELAASMAVETFVESFGRHAQPRVAEPAAFIAGTMRQAHERITRIPHNKDMGGFPGTTCVAVLVQEGIAYWGHAGDSRLYVLRAGAVFARTCDHSLVQQLVSSGMITNDEARIHPQRNQITNCLGGVGSAFYVETCKPVALQAGDVLLLGSDGLWGPITDQELIDAFAASPNAVAVILDKLIGLALDRELGRSDNITGLAVRWGGNESENDTAEAVSHVLDITSP